MLKKKIVLIAFLIAAFNTPFFINNSVFAVQNAPITATKPVPAQNVAPLDLVNHPENYMNRQILMDAKFDKFSTLGLDYKKAFRDSNDYVGFLIQRPDVSDHNVPLSELKLFVKRDYAEKFVDLNTGDKIGMSGKVFSNALGDAWVDIETITVLEKVPSNKE